MQIESVITKTNEAPKKHSAAGGRNQTEQEDRCPADKILSGKQQTALVLRKGIHCRQLDDEAVLYDLAHHTLHYLNASAHFIWKCCDGTRGPEDIATEMLAAFDLEGDGEHKLDTVLEDVHKTLAQLADDGLIDFDG